MELYRKSNVFERVLALYGSTICPETHRKQILELVYRSIKRGGGMTLITRVGIESWFETEQEDRRNKEIINGLEETMDDSIDREAAQQWRLPVSDGVQVP
jgi:Nucleolar pre-ribosomal-associated protein 1